MLIPLSPVAVRLLFWVARGNIYFHVQKFVG